MRVHNLRRRWYDDAKVRLGAIVRRCGREVFRRNHNELGSARVIKMRASRQMSKRLSYAEDDASSSENDSDSIESIEVEDSSDDEYESDDLTSKAKTKT